MKFIKIAAVFLLISTFAFLVSCRDATPPATFAAETEGEPAEKGTEPAETVKKAETGTDDESQSETETESSDTDPESDPLPGTDPEPESDPVPDSEPESDPTTEPTVGTEPPVTTDPVGYTSKGFPIEVRDGITYIDGLLVVNKTYSIPSSYGPGGMTAECSSAFYAMCADASAQGLSFYSVSDYRSYDTQSWLYQSYVDRDGKAEADTYSARPGHSEHQTGLAIDVNSTNQSFAYTAEGKWLAEHCWEYGFIIRYPQGKEWATGFIYEPWHIRYVGTWLSIPLRDSGLSVEEYFGIDSVYK